MRALTKEEKKTRDKLRKGFDRFYREMMPVLADFVDRLGATDAPMVITDPERFLGLIDVFMKDQVVEPDDHTWIAARIAYYIGELFVQRFGGCWFLNEIPDSRYFLRYVVGSFHRIKNHNAMFDPIDVAFDYCSEPPGRSLIRIVDEIDKELREA